MSGEYPFETFRSVDDLAHQIDKATTGWDTKWYRGLKSPTHNLLPTIFRDQDLRRREGYISVEFRRRSKPNLPGVHSQFDWLCALQHYGLPTRLLDWTESLPVALYFTVRPLQGTLPVPTVWVLNPFELYELTNAQAGVIPIANDECANANADLAFGDGEPDAKRVSELPIPVLPDFLFRRLAAQNGCFTIHGKNAQPLETLIPVQSRSLLKKFVADKTCVGSIYTSLDILIPSSDSIFPDIDGIKEYIV